MLNLEEKPLLLKGAPEKNVLQDEVAIYPLKFSSFVLLLWVKEHDSNSMFLQGKSFFKSFPL